MLYWEFKGIWLDTKPFGREMGKGNCQIVVIPF